MGGTTNRLSSRTDFAIIMSIFARLSRTMPTIQLERLSFIGARSFCAPTETPAKAAEAAETAKAEALEVAEEVKAVGPGASKTGEYKNPEFFLYTKMSYFDIEAEMAEHRCKQPSAENGQF